MAGKSSSSEGVTIALDDVVVVVIVTSEDILMYITIVYCCTPIGDVCSSFGDLIIVYGH